MSLAWLNNKSGEFGWGHGSYFGETQSIQNTHGETDMRQDHDETDILPKGTKIVLLDTVTVPT